MDGAGFGALLAGGRPLGRPRTVAERMALRRALARREFLTRR
jgi:hypothetical protein